MTKRRNSYQQVYNVDEKKDKKDENPDEKKVQQPGQQPGQQPVQQPVPQIFLTEISLEELFGGGNASDTKLPKKKKKNKEKEVKGIAELEKSILQCIIGQDEQVRKIITGIYRSIKFKSLKSNMLIIGKSGTGKTATVEEIAKRLGLPYTIEDATKYTEEGYVGASVEDMIYNLLENSDWDIEMAEKGILIIDEIDKKAGHDSWDVAGVTVIKSLLKMVEGTTIKVQNDDYEIMDFDTRNLIVIFMGAFSGLDEIRDKRLNKKQFGFLGKNENSNTESKKNLKFTKEDLIEFGMTEEFMGRIDTIVEMNELRKEDLISILGKSKLSIFKKYQKELKTQGIKLLYSRKLFERIAENSMMLNTGARELSNTVNYMFENILYDILSNPGKYTRCELDLDIVTDNTKYKLS